MLVLHPEVFPTRGVYATRETDYIWHGTKADALRVAEELRVTGRDEWKTAHAHPMMLRDHALSTVRFVVRCDANSVLFNFTAERLKVNAYFGPAYAPFLDLCRGEQHAV